MRLSIVAAFMLVSCGTADYEPDGDICDVIMTAYDFPIVCVPRRPIVDFPVVTPPTTTPPTTTPPTTTPPTTTPPTTTPPKCQHRCVWGHKCHETCEPHTHGRHEGWVFERGHCA